LAFKGDYFLGHLEFCMQNKRSKEIAMSATRVNLDAISQSAKLDSATQASTLETYGGAYRDLLGYVPPRIQSRFGITGVLDPELVQMQEAMRSHAMDTPHLDPKMVQIILFGMLLMDGNDAAETHCLAARRCGASWEELQATISLCFLFRGLPAANRGADLLARVAAREEPVVYPT
jgi:alkylhydroperoxidase/carboxymuconolactone decarboxylase family protein YurZ